MPKRGVTPADFAALRAEHARLLADMVDLREQVRQQANELRVQFERIAQIQAILDVERIDADRRARPARGAVRRVNLPPSALSPAAKPDGCHEDLAW